MAASFSGTLRKLGSRVNSMGVMVSLSTADLAAFTAVTTIRQLELLFNILLRDLIVLIRKSVV